MAGQSSIVLFLKKHRDRATLIGLLVGLVVFIGIGISLQKSGRDTSKESESVNEPNKVELESKDTDSTDSQQSLQQGTTAFFLKPTPAELLEQLEELEEFNENVVQAKFTGLRMLWPVYFFSLEESTEEESGKIRLSSDVSEDGFGVMVKADVSLQEYPQLLEVEQGQKIWIGGEILAIDPEGTGVIYLLVEHVTVGGTPPTAQDLGLEPAQ